jgi:glutamate synthase (NADPH/NADH) small chain
MQAEWHKNASGRWQMSEIPGTEEVIEADLVLLAMGFTMPVHDGLLDAMGVEYDARGNVKAGPGKETSLKGIFAAGDAERGASLVVHAIEAGKIAAARINEFLL